MPAQPSSQRAECVMETSLELQRSAKVLLRRKSASSSAKQSLKAALVPTSSFHHCALGGLEVGLQAALRSPYVQREVSQRFAWKVRIGEISNGRTSQKLREIRQHRSTRTEDDTPKHSADALKDLEYSYHKIDHAYFDTPKLDSLQIQYYAEPKAPARPFPVESRRQSAPKAAKRLPRNR